jgi:hypothetical protein
MHKPNNALTVFAATVHYSLGMFTAELKSESATRSLTIFP